MNLFKLAVILVIGLLSVAARVRCPKNLCNQDKPPKVGDRPGPKCKKIKEIGDCDADYVRGFCECTCQTCAFFEEIPDDQDDQDIEEDIDDTEEDIDDTSPQTEE